MKQLLRIYDYLKAHRTTRRAGLTLVTVALLCAALQLTYQEDISAFLPTGAAGREALTVYQATSGADRVVALFRNGDHRERTVEAVERFCQLVQKADTAGWATKMTWQVDYDAMIQTVEQAYSHAPAWLTETDYQRMDSLLGDSTYVGRCLAEDLELLSSPSAGSSLQAENVGRDPLRLFTPIVDRLQQSAGGVSGYELFDGYIFTADGRYALALIESPFGHSETEMNGRLVEMLTRCAEQSMQEVPDVEVRLTGGPVVAVGNARQIKRDSALALSLSVVIILGLLLYRFRSARSILLVGLSILWGWIVALAGMWLLVDSVSIIVVGISSVVLGIAVNYPLHLMAHTLHQPDMREALRDVAVPLVVGNVTTVGAFMALIPLESIALRHLGLFAALLLVGTIAFVLVFLPHMGGRASLAPLNVGTHPGQPPLSSPVCRGRATYGYVNSFWNFKNIALFFFEPLYAFLFGHRTHQGASLQKVARGATIAFLLLTAFFAYLSLDTGFDSDLAHINYMTDEQRADMERFAALNSTGSSDTLATIYVTSKAASRDEALEENLRRRPLIDSLLRTGVATGCTEAHRFLVSQAEGERRLLRWQQFVERHRQQLTSALPREAAARGFAPDAFAEFFSLLDYKSCNPRRINLPFAEIDGADGYTVVEKLTVKADRAKEVERLLPGSFDVAGMNSTLTETLSDNFNYIGIACSLIVFLFLWFSFGHVELALLSFLPMAVSWIWILGIMSLLGVKFNIVNIILATFIFGQGDDYTIFMTEGCCYEYARRRPMLRSYRSSIILSAFIMFAGIGTLILARHPALHSLAEVTIVGMACVLLTACLLPQWVFRWLTRQGGRYRKRPLKLADLLRTWYCGAVWLSQLLFGYVTGFCWFVLTKPTREKKLRFHRLVTAFHRLDLKLFLGVKFKLANPHRETFVRPSVIACNHQSMLDPMCLMALSPRILIVANRHSSYNPVVRQMFRWLDFYTIREGEFEQDLPVFRRFIDEGYSIAVFPEGERNPDSTILRFHKGAFFLARELGVDLLPVYLHGLNHIMPPRNFACHGGRVTTAVGSRIRQGDPLWGNCPREATRHIHKLFIRQYEELAATIETPDYFSCLVKDRYRYKGVEIYAAVRKQMKATRNFADIPCHLPAGTRIEIDNEDYGEKALTAALANPQAEVVAYESDPARMEVAQVASRGVARNLKWVLKTDTSFPKSI